MNKLISFLKDIINIGNTIQKILLLIFMINLSGGLFVLFTQNIWGDHSSTVRRSVPKNTRNIYTKNNKDWKVIKNKTYRSDVIIGFPKERIPDHRQMKVQTTQYYYSSFGLTYQELLLWLFIQVVIVFSMYLFKPKDYKEVQKE